MHTLDYQPSRTRSAPVAVSATAYWLPIAVALLNLAVAKTNGLYSRPAIFMLLAATVVFTRSLRRDSGLSGHRVLSVLIIVLQGLMALGAQPLNDVVLRFTEARPYYACVAVALLTCTLAIALPRLARALLIPALLATAVLGVWIIRTNPDPRVDVYLYQQLSPQSLLQGTNPYTITFPNPYAPAENWVFAPGTVTPDRILFGFPYMPVSLLGVLPGYLLGDYRYAHLAAILGTAALLGFCTSRRTGPLAAALLLTHSRLPWIIEWGWTEPLVGLLLVFAVVSVGRRTLSWVSMGLFLASKQYLALLVPLVFPRTPAASQRANQERSILGLLKSPGLLALIVASLVTLPLALWDFSAFWRSAAALQFAQPYRPDALSLPALLNDLFGYRPPNWIPLVVTFGVSLYLARHMPRTPSGLARALAIALPLLFILSKQAFANYYYLVAVAWCAMLATEPDASPSTPSSPAPSATSPPRTP